MSAIAERMLSSARSISASALTSRSSTPCSTVLPFASGRRAEIRPYPKQQETHPYPLGRSLNARKERTMIRLPVLLAVLAAALIAATSATAGTDPRKCVLNNPTACARTAAQTALRHKLQAVYHLSGLYQGPTACTAGSSWKNYRCTFGAGGTATVRFWATSTGWHVLTVITHPAG